MKLKQRQKKYLKRIVPGIITGGADNDPAGIATYSMSGALFGFGQLWLMVLAAPMAIAVQSMCARLGNAQKKGLTAMLLENFPRWVVVTAVVFLVISNIATIGADILALAAAFELISGIPFKYWIIPVTILAWYILVFLKFKTIRFLLLATIPVLLAYVLAAFLSKPDWLGVVKGIFTPSLMNLSPGYFISAIGILGTTLTPYLFFWHVRQQTEEQKTKRDRNYELNHEVAVNAPGFVFSQTITLFIMISAGATLFGQNIAIETAADAARALEPAAGQWASFFFAIGIIGSGLVALPVLAGSTAYAVGEFMHLKHGSLRDKPKRAKVFYFIITCSLLAGVAMWIIGLNPIKSLYYSQVLAGILTPLLLVLILIMANRESVVGEHKATKFENFFGYLALFVIVGAVLLMIKDFF